jgi:hypothetical protein
MKWLLLPLLLYMWLVLGAQLRTRYTPLPVVKRERRRILYFGRRRIFFVGYIVAG